MCAVTLCFCVHSFNLFHQRSIFDFDFPDATYYMENASSIGTKSELGKYISDQFADPCSGTFQVLTTSHLFKNLFPYLFIFI